MNMFKSFLGRSLGAALLVALILMLPSEALAATAAWQDAISKVDPKIFYAAIAGATWLLIYAWRRFLPAAWDFVTRKSPTIEQAPALVLAALMSAAPAFGKPMWDVVQQLLIGLVLGAAGIGIHTAMKESALPYRGAVKPVPTPDPVEPR